MAIEFNRIITLLRKERGITQNRRRRSLASARRSCPITRKASGNAALHLWYRLLIIKVSAVTTFGRSAERSGQTIKVEELPDAGASTSGSIYRGSVLPTMYKKLIENSLDILFDRLDQCRDKRVVTSVSNYLMLAVYRMFRRLYQAAPGNVASMFRVTPARWERDADAAMFLQEGELSATMAGENGACPDPAAFEMNTETLARDYPRHATSLMNLIKNSEEVVRKHNA